MVTGEVFTNPEVDLRLPGFFDLEVTRSYSTANRARDVGIGYGWTHSLAWSIEQTRSRELVVTAGDGSVEVFPPLRPGEQATAGPWGLLRTTNGFWLRPGTEFIHYFENTEGDPEHYRLVRVAYRDRGAIRLEYERGCLTRVFDTAGRVVHFVSDASGRVVRVFARAPDYSERTFVELRYDDNGDLVAAINEDGYETQFSYEDHRLVRLRYPSDVVFHFRYDSAGRCVETWGDGATAVLALDQNVGGVLLDGSPAKGIYHCRFDYSGDGYSEVVDSVRLQRFESAPAGLGKAVNARGGVTTREYDELGRPVALTDPTEATWVWAYDDMNAIVLVRGPEGDSIQVERDQLGRELRVFDAAGGATAVVRDVNGEVVNVRDQVGGEVNLRGLVRGLPTDVLDERGGRHRFAYDDQGNCIERVFPNGAVYSFEYDYWGHLTCTRNPDGGQLRTSYTSSGKVLAETDAVGRVTKFTYDAMGNLASRIEPDRTVTYFEYGGLNWLTRVTLPDGAHVRARYNREGWLVNFQNELGEEATRTYFPDGNLRTEKQFHGREVSIDRDLLGRITAVDSGRNRHEFELSKTGRLASHRAGDVTGRFEYDLRGELVRAAYPDAEVEFERDATGNVIRETFLIEGRAYWVSSTRNTAGDRLTLSTSLSHRADYGRDANGRVTRMSTADGSTLQIDRAAQGYVGSIRLPGGAKIADERDEAHRLRRRRVIAHGGETVTHERRYAYTEVDELAAVHEEADRSAQYVYDARRRVSSRVSSQGDEQFVVDAAGNYSEASNGRPLRRFGPGNQLLSRGNESYEYDSAGFLIAKTVATDAGQHLSWKFQWNSRELLEAVELPDGRCLQFGYDYLARRVLKRVTHDGETLAHWHYVWDGMSLLHEVLLGHDTDPASVRTYLYEDSHDPMPLAHQDSGDREWAYYVEDVVGAPVALVNSEGSVLARLERSTFGAVKVESTSRTTMAFRFPGQFEDTETGLHYNRYRYYDPNVGRYISPDPIGFWGGLNLYSYGLNPVGWTDPLGLVLAELASAPTSFQSFAASNGNYNANAGGYSSGGVVSPGLNTGAEGTTRNNGCGEQRFAQDLLAFGRTQAGRQLPRKKRRYRLEGKYPPCPTCHAALMRAAAETNSSVDYVWEQPKGRENKVTYRGVTDRRTGELDCRVIGQGDAGKRVTSGYDHRLASSMSGNTQTTQGYYGVGFSGESDATYAQLRNEQKEGR